MKLLAGLLGGMLWFLFSAPSPRAEPRDYRVYIKDGLRLDSADGTFRFKTGGRIHVDWGLFRDDKAVAKKFGAQRNEADFRRIRWYLSGVLYDRIVFKIDFDFVRDTTFKDVYIGIRKLPVLGNFRAGNFKRPYSLDALTGGNDLTFLERSLAQTFAKLRNPGFVLYDSARDDRLTWAVSLAKGSPSEKPSEILSGGNLNVAGRVTAVPWQNGDRSKLVHVGFGFQFNNPNDGRVKFSQRAEQHVNGIRLAGAGAVESDGVRGLRPEFAVLWNSLHVQGEYEFAHVTVRNAAAANLDAGYVEAGYWLTGETRSYGHGVWGRTRPRNNFLDGGRGAWQVAARYSFVDLNDGSVAGGKLHDITAGLNWWLNPNTAVRFNYVHSNVDDGQGRDVGGVDAFLTRFQVSF
ncbi:MAG: OprO/OprP family phosphate-selective porin [Nitrospinales bacterium]